MRRHPMAGQAQSINQSINGLGVSLMIEQTPRVSGRVSHLLPSSRASSIRNRACGGFLALQNPKGYRHTAYRPSLTMLIGTRPWSCSCFCQSSGPSMSSPAKRQTGQSWSTLSALRRSSYCFCRCRIPVVPETSHRPSSLHQSLADASSPPLSVPVRRGGQMG